MVLKLSSQEKYLATTFISRDLSEKEISQIESLTTLKCNNPQISYLEPVRDFKSLKKLNIKSTSINSLEVVKSLHNLEELICNYTDIESLEPLVGLKKLKEVQILNTELKTNAIVSFCKKRPDCKVIKAGF